MQPLANQCQDGDTLSICQVCAYQFKWKATRRSITYYTNFKLKYLAHYIFKEFNIPLTEYDKYGLKTRTQLTSHTLHLVLWFCVIAKVQLTNIAIQLEVGLFSI